MKSSVYRERINEGLQAGIPYSEIVREVYLSYPTFSFADLPKKEFLIKNAISNKFGLDIFSIHFGGSAKTGESYHKDSKFCAGKSDLDAAIISSGLFTKYLEITCEITKNFSDLTSFKIKSTQVEIFRSYLQRGVLIPEFMPQCPERTEWISFFNNLSQGNTDIFDNINCWIYSSQKLFELKFSGTIHTFKKSK